MIPAKILLFGEHIVLQGAQALAMPWTQFGGSWDYSSDKGLQRDLPSFLAYLQALENAQQLLAPINLTTFSNEIKEGLYFKSNIPTGYGAGSSGALTAAIYQRYLIGALTTDLKVLKQQLGQMESYFHGASSGTDPMICLLNQAVLIDPEKGFSTLELDLTPSHLGGCFFVLDTGQPRKAEPWIQFFKQKCKDQGFQTLMHKALILNSNQAIHALVAGQSEVLFDAIDQISLFQIAHLAEMIPTSYQPLWRQALEGDALRLKICGAGGGGFILGFCRTEEELSKLIDRYQIY
ncbi:MAG: hypothetical protein AAF242_17245, partial [Bacteroidota bacterium]